MRPSMPFEDTLLSLSFFPYLLATSTTFSSTITEHLFLFSHSLFFGVFTRLGPGAKRG